MLDKTKELEFQHLSKKSKKNKKKQQEYINNDPDTLTDFIEHL